MIYTDDMIDSLVVAKYFLTKSELTPKKLQKLVYYAYAWFIALNNENLEHLDSVLFDEAPQAWIHGPVFRNIYNQYQSFKWHEIPQIDEEMVFENDEIIPFLDKVYDVYGGYDADQLEYMTHNEAPWQNARNGLSAIASSDREISKKDIFIYYNNLSYE